MRPVLRSSLQTSIPKSAASAGRNGETDTAQTEESLDFAGHVAQTARIARLHCNMEDEAAAVCRAWIEEGGHA